MENLAIVIFVIVCLFADFLFFKWLFNYMFEDFEDFANCFESSFSLSLFGDKSEYDNTNKTRLSLFIISCIGTFVTEFIGLRYFLENWF